MTFAFPFSPCSRLPYILSSLTILEAAAQYLLVEDGLRQFFREYFLLDLEDLEVRPWYGELEHEKPG